MGDLKVPSLFAISIQVPDETKWELCFDLSQNADGMADGYCRCDGAN